MQKNAEIFLQRALNLKTCNLKTMLQTQQTMCPQNSILLHKIFNTQQPSLDWVEQNKIQTITSRETHFKCVKTSRKNRK